MGTAGHPLPTGTVTFLFTDIEGSTRLLQELGESYARIQDQHAAIMRRAISDGQGREIRTEGDAFFAVFPTAVGALRAAVSAQRGLDSHPWPHGRPLRVRMGLHTGQGRLGGDDYLGIDVNRAARIAAAGHGGQVLLSDPTRSLVEHDLPEGVSLRDLGEQRLKDLARPEHIQDLVIDGLPATFPPLKTLEAPSNLPAELTSFVGRERDVERVTDLLGRSRLVTLTGPGGTGKTRLAVQAARRVVDGFTDGVFFVDLSPITDPRLVPDTIASALRFPQESSARPMLDIVTDHLRDRTVLLVLDNFEQVLPGAGSVASILQAAPSVRGLVTSRSPLGLTGEQEVPVPPMELPDPAGDPAVVRRSEAVELFAERAAAVDPAFSLTEDSGPVVAEICARLDALPLAIELAAARVRMLPVGSLLGQLQPRLPMLVGGPRDAPERQRTLRATIAWSYDLLDAPVQAVFRRLSVFAGGWTLDTARDVADPRGELGDPLERLEILLQQSLVQRAADDVEGRLRTLEIIREFGLERLQEAGETEEVKERHARRFAALAEEAEPYLTGPDQRRWFDLLNREHDNFRAALGWSIDNDRGELALRLGGPVWRFWYGRGHLDEGRRWLTAAVSLPSSEERSTWRARGLTGLGGIAYWQSDFQTALASYQEALEIHRELGDRAATVQALLDFAATKAVMGDPPAAVSLMREGLELARELGDRRGEAWALWGLGAATMFGGDAPGAQGLIEQSLDIFEQVGDDTWGLGNALAALAGLAAMQGDAAKARTLVLRAINAWEDQGNALVIAGQLNFMAMAADAEGRADRAVTLAAASESLRKKTGGKVPDAFFPFGDPRDRAAEALDEDTVERLWAEGLAMTLEEALAYAREEA